MTYFTYGSNISSRRLRERVPSARPIGRAKLAGYSLAWHKIGRDGSGKCDVVEAGGGDHVWGVLYRMDPAERHLLDRAEDLGHGYEEKIVDVVVEGDEQPVRAFTYRALQIDSGLRPSSWYNKHVLTGPGNTSYRRSTSRQ
tara:strand:+ start:326 stop:748 length:423 start_codon:yes stop_codon:yes gene_type:complete